MTFLLALVLPAGRAAAQTAATAPAEAAKQEAAVTTDAAVPGPTAADAVVMNARTDSAGADAKAEPPQGQPAEQPPAKGAATATPPPNCRNVSADVVALFQPIMLNRMGAAIPNGLVFSLARDLAPSGKMLRPGKRPRPLVLRANVGDCLTINFWNLVQPPATQPPPPPPATSPTPPPLAFPDTKPISIHVQGMEWVKGPQDDGSYVGLNNTSLATPTPSASPLPSPTMTYTLYAKNEGTFLLYTMGDTSSQGDQLVRGLFGSVNIQPKGAEWYRSQVTADEMALATYNANRLPAGATLGSCNGSNECTLTVAGGVGPPKQIKVIRTPNGNLNTMDNHPLINYNAVYPAGSKWADGTPIPPGTPILQMLDTGGNPIDQGGKLVYSDLTATITGPNAGRFPGTTGPNNPEPPCNAEKNPALQTGTDPLFCANPAAPDRKQPYREITIMYHGALAQVAMQAFPVFNDPTMVPTVAAGNDAFAINYGTGGIGAEIYANRIGVGPMAECVDCKYEEFFLSSWTVGDPAMLVDVPANSNFQNMQNQRALVPPCNTTAAFEGNTSTNPPGPPNPNCANARIPNPANPGGQVQPYTLVPKPKATRVFFPDDPSNVYHSYMNDHVKFRILHGGVDVSHVHHQHAHQWLQSPNSDESSYLDSQMISPGASYTLEMTYNGSGNRNKTAGDSIFHCHFYPHFAAGMWAMWRVHDTFESGTYVFPSGSPKAGQVVPGARALPDGEIDMGAPTPAIVPLPTIPMAPLPSYAQINKVIRVDGPNTVKLNTPLEPPVSGVCQNNMVNGMDVVGGCANGQNVNGTIISGQIVVGGTCQNNMVNGLTVVGNCVNGQRVYGTVINSQFDGTQMTGQLVPSDNHQIENPGFPYFIPGIAGARAPHPPFDFAVDPTNGGIQDGGLPRHVVIGGEIGYERHNKFDWSKDLSKMNATRLPEDGTAVEKAAIAFFSRRCYETYFPDGTKGNCPSSQSTPPHNTMLQPPTGFIFNGLPNGPQHGAPFADPGVDDNGNPVGTVRRYKIAAMQVNVVFNKQKWHFPQQRMLSLWQDVQPTYAYKFGQPGGRRPEPLFIRGNAGDIVEFWHTNLVPNYYLVDDFQVRTPTDIIGQHVHLVKFDVTASDGAANGYNYEDGTYSPQEVQEMVAAINSAGGMMMTGSQQSLTLKTPPKEIIDCAANPNSPYCKACTDHPTPTSRPMCPSWLGAQTTIQRWYLDPLVDNSNFDRTMRTTFTHDHFGPSTHQQAGLYAGLLIEPLGSVWKNSETGEVMPSPARMDGGPTSWKADILTKHPVTNEDISYREFMLEFQDFQLAYNQNSIAAPSDNPSQGWIDKDNAIVPPPTPQLISTALARGPGTHSVNYLNEPLPFRVGQFGELSNAYSSSATQGSGGPQNGDPITPLMRAYQGDRVQVRVLVGAHVFAHQFNIAGPVWPAEPFWKDSGYRSAQPMGLSEHFELLFQVPSSATMNSSRKCPDGTSQGNCVDFLYSPSLDELGLANGMWGLFRSYDPRKGADRLQYLTSNPKDPNANLDYSTCPANLQAPAVKRVYNIFAVAAQKALVDISPIPGSSPKKGQIVFNDRGNLDTPKRPQEVLHNTGGIMYVRAEDLVSSTPNTPGYGKLKPGTPIEPLVLRANAGDCIEVNLTNYIDPNSDLFNSKFKWAAPFDSSFYQRSPSKLVGLHPQLLAYDGALSNGVNVGWNSQGQQDQSAAFGQTVKYQWYAGKIERDQTTKALVYTPVEFGALNLMPSDPVFQQINGLFGSMIIEPAGSTWKCDKEGTPGGVDCDQPGATPPTTRAQATVTLSDGTTRFREFALMISDNMIISKSTLNGSLNTSAVNYRTEPMDWRYNNLNATDFSCMLSNQLKQKGRLQIDPQTPLLTAGVGDPVRFRMTHPFGTGTSQVFTVHGHVWQKNPYLNESTVIGDQLLSQWIGSRDNHGSTDHFDAVIGQAGGEFGRAGDYLYTVFLPNQAKLGAWGVFRVGTPQGTPTTMPQCTPPLIQQSVQPPPPKKNEAELQRFIRQPQNKNGTLRP
ncbi:MAG TPA: hypothetical protein VN256_23325 [Pyrinomonadaceae bacterium]|nr:hypothetical protein [Pyrinomonadaceae bacterium]